MAKKIKVSVTADLEVKIESTGYAGASCRDATKSLEAALGERISEAKTKEFFQASTKEDAREQASS